MERLIEQDVSIPRTGLVVISFEIKRAQVGAAILERYVDRPSEPESNPRRMPSFQSHVALPTREVVSCRECLARDSWIIGHLGHSDVKVICYQG